MVSAFAKAVAQLGDPVFRRTLLQGVAAAAALFALLWAAIFYALTRTALSEIGWLETVLDALGGLATLLLTVILFPAVAAGALSLLIERVIVAVEMHHYPALPPPRALTLAEQIGIAARFTATLLLLNLAVLPLYLIPVVNVLVFYALNGYLLGREYFEMVAPRRFDGAARRTLWRRHRLELLLAGVVIAFVSSLPLVNLAAPVIGAAAMTHLVETYRRALGRAPAPPPEAR